MLAVPTINSYQGRLNIPSSQNTSKSKLNNKYPDISNFYRTKGSGV